MNCFISKTEIKIPSGVFRRALTMVLSFLLFTCISGISVAEQTSGSSKYMFNSTVYDFGTVSDRQRKLSCSFIIENIGEVPLFIQNVSASCGCTKVTWSKETIAPKDSGKICVVYSNDRGPHSFDKAIMVSISGEKKPVILHIRGNVIREPGGVQKEFPYKIGDVCLRNTYLNLGNVLQEEKLNSSISLYNSSRDTIQVRICSTNNNINFPLDSVVIPGNSVTDLRFELELSDGDGEYGKHVDSLYISSNSLSDNNWTSGILPVHYKLYSRPSNVEPYPIAEVVEKHIPLGHVKRKQIIHKTINITNRGAAPLNIFHVEADKNVSVNFSPTGLQPGDTLSLDVTLSFQSFHRKRKNATILDIYTDSGIQPVRHVILTYRVNRTVKEFVFSVIDRIFRRPGDEFAAA